MFNRGAPVMGSAPSPIAAWRLALRLLRRDWRSGELYLLAAALILTVAAITAVGFFTDRIETAMQRQGGELLAADLAIDATGPIPASLADEAEQRGLQLARTLTFRSVVFAGETSQLVQVKAVDAGYPLRGELRVNQRSSVLGTTNRAANDGSTDPATTPANSRFSEPSFEGSPATPSPTDRATSAQAAPTNSTSSSTAAATAQAATTSSRAETAVATGPGPARSGSSHACCMCSASRPAAC